MSTARAVARDLHDRLRRKGCKNAHGLPRGADTRDLEEGGAMAELAASLMLGVPWTAGDPQRDDTGGPDIGRRTQVRSSMRPRRGHHLIVRPADLAKYADVPFLLVIQTGANFVLKGWMMAMEAARRGRLWDGGNGRPPAWFVHEALLHDIGTLEDV